MDSRQGQGQPARRRTPLSAAVAAQLRAERAAAQLTFDELAQRSGISRFTIMRLLNEHRTMDMSQFAAMCDGLDLSPVVVMARATNERFPLGRDLT